MPIVFALERTNQLSLLPDKDLGRLMPPDQTIPSNEEPFYFSHNASELALLVSVWKRGLY
ncbi:MAG: hypothetical protein ACKPGT_32880 [Microcystis sp.]